jgi:hypothetical protein
MSLIWPQTAGGCFAVSMLILPAICIPIDLVPHSVETAIGVKDFGLSVSWITLPLGGLLSLGNWNRGVRRLTGRNNDLVLPTLILTSPLWCMLMLIQCFFLFPFGRINDSF